jgi:hypothetical protein
METNASNSSSPNIRVVLVGYGVPAVNIEGMTVLERKRINQRAKQPHTVAGLCHEASSAALCSLLAFFAAFAAAALAFFASARAA